MSRLIPTFLQSLNQNFLLLALLAGTGIAVTAGPLGCIMVWRRLSNFGDTLAHGALLGIAISLFFQLPLYIGLFGLAILIAIILTFFSRQAWLGNEVILVILTNATLALGLLFSTYLQHQGYRLDLLSYLYGDILSVSLNDLGFILLVDVLIFLGLWFWWEPILSLTLHEDLANIDGISSTRTKFGLFLIIALIFAVAVKLVGVLLLTALFIIPAAGARQLAKTPETMAILASLLGVLSVCLGIYLSDLWDLPTGPLIVMVATVFFLGLYFKNIVKT